MTFYSFKCKHCGYWGSKEIRADIKRAKFNCKFCRKSTSINSKNNYGLALDHKGPYNRGIDAANTTRTMNEGGLI